MKKLITALLIFPFSLSASNPNADWTATSALQFQQQSDTRISVEDNLIRFFTGNNERLTINSNGNVGIGTTVPNYLLHVNGNSGFTGQLNLISAHLYQSGDFNISTQGAVKIKNYLLFDSNGDFTGGDYFTIQDDAANNYLRLGYGFSNDLVIKDSGNVGIGTTTPNEKLQVTGNISLGHRLDNSTRYIGKPTALSGGALGSNSNWIGFVSTTTEDYLTFSTHLSGTSGGERMRIDALGNLGIGTQSPIDRLTLNGGDMTIGNTTNHEYNIWFRPGDNFPRSSIIGYSSNVVANDYIGMKTRWGSIRFITNDGNEVVRITDSERVGIGTITPSNKFQVSFDNNPLGFDQGIRIHTNPSDYTAHRGGGIITQNADVNTAGIFGIREENNWKGALTFYTHTSAGGNTFGTTFTEKMRLTSTGNLGIGTTSPSYPLHVNGTVRATNFISNTQTYADFVFEDDYKLRSLNEVEEFIKKNNHLPDIPSEAEAKANGTDLQEMQAKLLQKIEELTLYVIDLKKENKSLLKRTEKLESQIGK